MRYRLSLILGILFPFALPLVADPAPGLSKTLQIPAAINDFVWDPVSAHFFTSSAQLVYIIDPESATILNTLSIGEPAGKLAISSDGQYLYVQSTSRNVIKRYRTRDSILDFEIAAGGTVIALAAVPGEPQAILVSSTGTTTVFDGKTPRAKTIAFSASSLSTRPGDKSIYGANAGRIYSFSVDAGGVTSSHSVFAAFSTTAPVWSGYFASDFDGHIYDVRVGSIGKADNSGVTYHYPSAVDPSGQTFVEADGNGGAGSLVAYSMTTFRPIATFTLTREQTDQLGVGDFTVLPRVWGTDGLAVSNNGHSGPAAVLSFLHLSGMTPVPPPPAPIPVLDSSGVTHLPFPANSLVFDAANQLLWASVPGSSSTVGNSVVSIDPTTGRVVDVIPAGSEPGLMALSGDGSQLYTLVSGSSLIATIDLTSRQVSRNILPVDSDYVQPIAISSFRDNANNLAVIWLSTGGAGNKTIVYGNGFPRPKVITTTGLSNGPLFSGLYDGDAPNSLYGVNLGSTYGSGARDVTRLVTDDNGIAVDRSLTPFPIGLAPLGTALVYSNGSLFNAAGEVRTPDGQTLLATFGLQQTYATWGVPIPLLNGQVAYAFSPGLGGNPAVTLFDGATSRPISTMALKSVPNAAAAAGDRIAVSAGSEILLLPMASLSPWPQYVPNVQQSQTAGIRTLTLAANAISGLPGTSKLIVALPSSAGNIGNSIAVLNPDTGQIESPAYMGSEPTMLRVTPDGSSAYAYLSGENRIARFNVGAAQRDLVIVPDPTGGTTQYPVSDMAAGPDASLTAAIGGWLAVFDNGILRPTVDKNTQGPGAYSGAPYKIVLNPAGTIAYSQDDYWSIFDFKRDAIDASGIHYLSGSTGLIRGKMVAAGSLIFCSSGDVLDLERTRLVGHLDMPGGPVAPDLDAGRIYAASGNQLYVFDSKTYAKLAAWNIAPYNVSAKDLTRFGTDGLAMQMTDGQMYIVRISAIPLLPQPVPSTQPALPSTPGVTVVDLAARDLAYDAARDRIYAAIPASEAANGNQIAQIDPSSGAVTATWPTGQNPSHIALSGDASHLFFSSGTAGSDFLSGYSLTSESITELDLSSGSLGASFPHYPSYPGTFFTIVDLAAIPGQSRSVATIDADSQGVNGAVASGVNSLRIYDAGISRPSYLLPHTFTCYHMIAGASSTEMYCSDAATFYVLALSSSGVSIKRSFRLLPGRGSFGPMAYNNGRVYTSTGLVIEPSSGKMTRLTAQGPVAATDSAIYWLDSGPSFSSTSYTLRTFDPATLQEVSSRTINVTATTATRLIAGGQGRLVFASGHEVYIVNP